jgi:hypothetical protein
MKKPSYRAGVAWIAAQDESNLEDLEAISVEKPARLLAKLFDRDEKLVALEGLRRRLIAIAARESEEFDESDFGDDESEIDQE